MVAGRPAQPGTDEVMIGKRLRGQFKGLELGQSFELKKNRPVKVVGVFEAGGSSFESEIWADIDTVRTSFGREGMVSSVTVALESPRKFDAFKSAIEHDKQLGLQVLREIEYFEKQSEGTRHVDHVLGGAIVVFFSIGAMIGAMITMYGAVAQPQARDRHAARARLLALHDPDLVPARVGAAGADRRRARRAGVAGDGLGRVLDDEHERPGPRSCSRSTRRPEIVLGAMLAGGMMGVLGGLLPAVRAARVSPIAAMRE